MQQQTIWDLVIRDLTLQELSKIEWITYLPPSIIIVKWFNGNKLTDLTGAKVLEDGVELRPHFCEI